MKPIYTFIANVTMYSAQDILPTLPEGTPLALVRELDNPYNSSAIVINYQGVALGHIPARTAERIAPLMDKGHYVMATLTRVKIRHRAHYADLRVSFNLKCIDPDQPPSANEPHENRTASGKGEPISDEKLEPVPKKNLPVDWGRLTSMTLAIFFLLVFLNRGCGGY